MYHRIEFLVDVQVDLTRSPRHPLERLSIRKGSRLRAQVRPYVVEGGDGPVEVADLFFLDGTAALQVRFACFTFVR
jgi:hypothetical protein